MLLEGWLRKHLGVDRLSVERVVSGTGLGLIYLWLEHCGAVEEHFPFLKQLRPGGIFPPAAPIAPIFQPLWPNKQPMGGP